MNTPAPRETYEVVSVKVRYEMFVAISELADMRAQTRSDVLRDMMRFYFMSCKEDLIQRGFLDQFGNVINNNRRSRK